MSEPTPQMAATAIRARFPRAAPRMGLILGSGLGRVAEAIEDGRRLPYSEIPGFPNVAVTGHSGELVVGRLGGMPVACLKGRAHLYEGVAPWQIRLPVRTLKLLGCDILILTNAAGSLRADIGPGRLMLISDHINFMGSSPLVGPNDEAFGPRFPSLDEAYDPDLRQRARATAKALAIDLVEGVYLACLGPAFETPAEIRAFARLGADAVGMSTVPEALVAQHCAMRVLGLSVITNLATGLGSTPHDHAQTLTAAESAADNVRRLVVRLCEDLACG